ncbi:MAG: PAS domain S-box protein, partial [Fibrobacterota bacterium]
MNTAHHEEDRFQTILECSRIGTWEWNIQTGEVSFNDIWAEIVGYTRDELAPLSITTWEDRVHPRDLEKTRSLLNRHFSGEDPYYECEFRMKHKNGQWVWIHSRGRVVSWSPDKKPLKMCGTHDDITKTKKVQEELRRERELAERIIEDGPIAITQVNRDGQIVFANHHAESLLGLKKAPMGAVRYNSPDWQITSVDNTPFPEEELPFCRIMSTKKPVYDVRHAIVLPHGERKILSINGAPLHDETGQIEKIVFAMHDITEREENKKQLTQIEWMLSGRREGERENLIPEYGDLTQLNKEGLILSSLGKEQLREITSEYLDLLETATAVYEKNGDYAMGLFSSSWCRLMDSASRKLCKTESNEEALGCGKWLCHESCWHDAAVKSIESGEPVDIKCNGGIRLYTVPIRVRTEIIGTISFGYGTPPDTDSELQHVSEQYQIPLQELRAAQREYQVRPQYIIDYAKKRITISARHIGNLVEHKLAEQKRIESEALLSRTQEIAHVGSWQLDLITDTLVWSDEVYRIFGCTPRQFPADYGTFLSFIHPEDRAEVDAAYGRSVKEGRDRYEIEHRIIRQDTNETGHVFERCIHIRDDAGTIIRSIGMIQDITEAKKTQNALEDSEKKFRALFEKGPIGVAYHKMLYDKTGHAVDYRFLDANSSYLTLTGVDPRGKCATEAFPGIENDPFDWIGTFGRVAKTGEEIHFEQYLQSNNRWYNCVAYQVKEDYFVAAFMEITERKKAEQALREQHDFTESLIETAQTIILVLDKQGRIVRFNPYMETLTGYTLDEVQGKDWFNTFLSPREELELKPLFKKAIDDTPTRGNVNPIITKKGTTVIVEWYDKPLTDKDGTTVGLLAIGHDITEQKKAEEALRESEARFSALFSSMTEMVVLHELIYDDEGTPVNYRIIDCNNAFTAITKIPRENAIGQLATRVYNTDSAPYLREYAHVARTGEPYTFETYYPPLDKYFSISAVQPQKNQFATVTADITEARKSEDAIAAEKEQLAVTLRSIGDGVITTDTAGKIVLMNKIAENLTGWTQEEARG